MKVGICSLGCKVNIYESEVVTDLLKKGGYEIVPFEDKADIYIPIYTLILIFYPIFNTYYLLVLYNVSMGLAFCYNLIAYIG